MKIIRHILDILNFYSPLKSYFFLFLIFISSLLEVFSLALIYPIVKSLLNPNIILEINSFFVNTINLNLNLTLSKLIYFFLIVFIFKTIFFLLVNFKIIQETQKIAEFISVTIFKRYIKSNINFLFKKKQSEILNTLVAEQNIFSYNAMRSFYWLVSETLIVFLILCLLAYINFKITVIVTLIFSLAALIYFFLIKKYIYTQGNIRVENEKERIFVIQTLLGLFKEIRLYDLEKSFQKIYKKIYNRITRSLTKSNFLHIVPKQIFEIIVIIFFVFFIIDSISNNLSIEYIVGTLGIFSVAFFRTLPSAIRITNSLQSIKWCQSTVENLHNEIFSNFKKYEDYKYIEETKEYNDKLTINNWKKIEIKNINFSYDDKKILENYNLLIKKNDFIGIEGSSGVGKSTFLNIICGLLLPTSGLVKIDEIDIKKVLKKWQQKIAFIPQKVYLFNGSLIQNITLNFESDDVNKSKIEEITNLLELNNLLKKNETIFSKKIEDNGSNLSGGQIQRIGIARALYFDREIFLLDEITNGLDPKAEKLILDILLKLKSKKTMIFISHKRNNLANTDKIIKFN